MTKEDEYSKRAILECEETNGDHINTTSKWKIARRARYYKCLMLTFLSLSLIVTLVLLAVSRINLNTCEERSASFLIKSDSNICTYSEEANRIKLGKFLVKLEESYYEMFPGDIAWHPEVTKEMILDTFAIHDPRPEHIQAISERADELLNEAIALKPDLSKLKPREHKAYLQALHFLESTFATPYLNFKSGLWLLGPSSFCVERICDVGYVIYNSIGAYAPENKKDVERIVNHFKAINQSVYEYIDVLKTGVKKGMVRTRGECEGGIDAIKKQHFKISQNGPVGVLSEWYAKKFSEKEFYSEIEEDLDVIYFEEYGLNVSSFIVYNLKECVGKSIKRLLVFLETEHYDACRPNDVGPGGLSALPLNVIYSNGSIIPNSKTNPYLPFCSGDGCRLNGSEAYARVLNYHTTKNIHPNAVHKLGWENVERIYPQMIKIAKDLTNVKEEKKAVKEFQKLLKNLSISYFHDKPLPENETNREAHANCHSDETAKRYCPQRWAAMMRWLKFAQSVMSMHEPNTIDFFYFNGEDKSTPSCPVKLRINYNPSMGIQSYDVSDYLCSTPCYYNIPFFLEHLGPKYSEYSINAHEARPGHHTQFQGYTENFGDKCGGPESWLQHSTYYTAFTEGWALYSENPLIAQDTNVYETNKMQKYGMLKWQMWRALRLIIDTGLHYKGYSRKEALKLFEKYAWDNTDLSKKEVTRYQSNYGQATAYMIGQLDIWSLRNETQDRLKEKFSLKEFHLQTLSQGSSPLAFLKSHINKYITCKLNTTLEYCDIILNPTKETNNKQQYSLKSDKNVGLRMKKPHRSHYL